MEPARLLLAQSLRLPRDKLRILGLERGLDRFVWDRLSLGFTRDCPVSSLFFLRLSLIERRRENKANRRDLGSISLPANVVSIFG